MAWTREKLKARHLERLKEEERQKQRQDELLVDWVLEKESKSVKAVEADRQLKRDQKLIDWLLAREAEASEPKPEKKVRKKARKRS